MELQFRVNENQDDDLDHELHIDQEAHRIRNAPDTETHTPVTTEEVRKLIKTLPLHKSPGKFGITGRMIKEIAALTGIANAILQLRYFPKTWEEAKITMLPKPGKDLKFPQNYRPISLLPAVGKVIERLLVDWIKTYSQETNSIPPTQFDFKENHSTELQLLRIKEHAHSKIHNSKLIAIAALDVEKAFDRVWHNTLIVKMLNMGYSLHLIKTIFSFLNERTFYIQYENYASETKQIEAGVPQGSPLSPHLYNIYTNDIPQLRSAKIALFADNTALISSAKDIFEVTNKLQKATNKITKCMLKWKIKPNADKTQAIIISKGTRPPARKLKIEGKDIKSSEIKYLEVTVDNRLT